MVISITRIGSNLKSKGARAVRFPVPDGALDKARTAADVLAVVRANAKQPGFGKSKDETHGMAIKRMAEGGSKVRAAK